MHIVYYYKWMEQDTDKKYQKLRAAAKHTIPTQKEEDRRQVQIIWQVGQKLSRAVFSFLHLL